MLKRLSFFFLFSFLWISTAQGQEQQQGNAQLETAGQVVWVKGVVRAMYPEQAARILARGSLVYSKDTLLTETTGSGEVAFTDNTLLSLRPGTTFQIEHYHFDQAHPSSGGSFITKLVVGGFRTITGFVAKAAPSNYQVNTPVATIGVRGTTYQVNCQHNGQCGVGLENGTGVTVSNTAGTVVLTYNNPYATVVSPTAMPVVSTQLPAILAKPPQILPANIPPPSAPTSPSKTGGGGNCGILIQ